MTMDEMLEKTTRINGLYDFYAPLLTEKQRTFLQYYYQDNYSLGEIAEEFGVSRQAIYEHIKRAEHCIEDYEHKLKLNEKFEKRRAQTLELLQTVEQEGGALTALRPGLQQLLQMD